MQTECPLEAKPAPTVAELETLLSQAQAEITRLKKVHAQETLNRKQVENELTEAKQLLQLVMDTLPEAIFWKDRNSVYLGCNRNFADDAGLANPQDIIGKTDYDMPWEKEESDFFRECDRKVMLANQAEIGIVEPQLQADGTQAWLETNKAPLHNSEGNVIGILGTYQNITGRKQAEIALQEMNQKLARQTIELTAALQQLQQSQLHLVQQEKMSALGNLVAGIAHEINNPIGFLSGNLRPAQDYTKDLIGLIELYRETLPNPGEEIEAEIEEIDLDYICEDVKIQVVVSGMSEGISIRS
ncbi:MAG: PAS domain-containing protein [Phormidesmis sp.]